MTLPRIAKINRSGSQDDIKHINYETREDLRAQGGMDRYRERAQKPKER